jgi:hypothetical protein
METVRCQWLLTSLLQTWLAFRLQGNERGHQDRQPARVLDYCGTRSVPTHLSTIPYLKKAFLRDPALPTAKSKPRCPNRVDPRHRRNR